MTKVAMSQLRFGTEFTSTLAKENAVTFRGSTLFCSTSPRVQPIQERKLLSVSQRSFAGIKRVPWNASSPPITEAHIFVLQSIRRDVLVSKGIPYTRLNTKSLGLYPLS